MKLKKRRTALLMAATMGFSTLSNPMIINAQMTEEGLCEHHAEHTAECGYTENNENSNCSFVCEICDSQFVDQGLNEQAQSDLEQVNTLATTNDVEYLDENGNIQTANNVTEVGSNDTNWSDGWYVVSGDVTIESRIKVEGIVHLILKNGASLNVKGGIGLQSNTSFTIYAQSIGDTMGSLTATEVDKKEAGIGGDFNKKDVTIIINGGNVTATGGEDAAGIGGGANGDNATVTINGGKVIATGGTKAAGIGSGENDKNATVTIKGGNVTATGGTNGPGIGGGERGNNATVTIYDGDITAKGSYGAGIGGASTMGAGTITIHGGNITAEGSYGAGIGGGNNGSGGNITIHEGNITAKGSYGAGIGGGSNGSGGTIIIEGGNVNATSERSGAGIGGGSGGSGGEITIIDGNITATGSYGAGIGGGSGGSSGEITINGGDITTTGNRGAGIGGGNEGSGETILINGGDITTTGDRGAGIGGGNKGSGGTITIEGGNVNATSERSGAGIGGGDSGSGGTITIESGKVNATNKRSGAGIGGGSGGSGGTFTTGENGNALITANGGISDQSNKDKWKGIIFEDNHGTVYGNQTLQENLEIQPNQTLTIPQDSTLTVNKDVTLTCNGKINGEGTLTGEGTLAGSGTVASSVDNHFQKESSIVVTLNPKEITYGSNVVITARISEDSRTFEVEPNEVVFFVEIENNMKILDRAMVNNDTAEITIKLTDEIWKAGQYTITAEYGGSMELKPKRGTATLIVNKAQQTDKPTISECEVTTDSITINVSDPNQEAVEYACVPGEYPSVPSDVQWTTMNTFEDLTAGTPYTVFARYAENEYYLPSEPSEGKIVYTVPKKPEASVVTIDYDSETISFDETMYEVKTTRTGDGINIESGDSITDYIKDTEQKIYVRLKEKDDIPASEYQEVTIPARLGAPVDLQGVNETYMGANNGKITGVSAEMEYQKVGESDWTTCTGTTIENLAPTTYRVRHRATEKAFASDSVEIVIATKKPEPGSGGGSTAKVNPVYRAYNPNNGEHLYTLDEKEYKHVVSLGWHEEGIAFMGEEEKNGLALFRVYNPNSGLHHYTLDENEKNILVSLGWHDEKVAWYTSKKPQSAPVYRVYNPNDGNHHYTMDGHEKDVLVSLGWDDEGLAFRTAPIETK